MKVTELKNKIIIAELDPKKDYIVLVSAEHIRTADLQLAKGIIPRLNKIPIVRIVGDIDKAIRFVEVPKPKSK